MSTPAKIIDQNLPAVAIVGRVNVGKSALFNYLTESRRALVSSIPGTTRTSNSGIVTWRGKNFELIDTGGLTFDDRVPLEEDIILQTEMALKRADAVIFLTDVKEGILPQEKELARRLMIKNKEKIIFAANKADNPSARMLSHEHGFLKLGLGEPILISALNGSGTGDLLDKVYSILNKSGRRPKQTLDIHPIKVALIGKPNVGKSSLFNKIIGEERAIVNVMPHTTREPHDILVEAEGQHFIFIDTAGIRRKTKVSGELERIGVGKSLETISRADIVLFVIDASEPITDQDQQLAGFLREQTRSAIIVVNKWDLSENNTDQFRNEAKEKIYANFPHLKYAPIVFVSAKTSYRVHQIFPMLTRAWEERHIVIPPAELKAFMKDLVRRHLPSRGRGVRHPEVLDLLQINSNPPIFEMVIKARTSVNISYANFVANCLREKYSFFATPVIIKLSKMKKTYIA